MRRSFRRRARRRRHGGRRRRPAACRARSACDPGLSRLAGIRLPAPLSRAARRTTAPQAVTIAFPGVICCYRGAGDWQCRSRTSASRSTGDLCRFRLARRCWMRHPRPAPRSPRSAFTPTWRPRPTAACAWWSNRSAPTAPTPNRRPALPTARRPSCCRRAAPRPNPARSSTRKATTCSRRAAGRCACSSAASI